MTNTSTQDQPNGSTRNRTPQERADGCLALFLLTLIILSALPVLLAIPAILTVLNLGN